MKVEMKDSGIEWIGEIPKDWELFKIKNIVSIKNGKEVPKSNEKEQQEENILVYGSGGAFTNTFDILHIGPSVLLGRKGTIDRPQFINENTPFWCVDTAFYTTPKEYQSIKFFYYCMFVLDYKEYIYGTALPSMTQSLLNEIKLPVPPFHTQQQIANFLDDKCADIDQLITLQQQMIDELKAYKQSVITEAVCKGLDKSVPMKDSGIEWIGEVPERWICSKLKYNLSLINGRAYSQDELLSEGKYTILRVGNLFTNSSWYYSDMELTPDKYCDKGDLLYAWSASFGPQIWEGDKVIYHYHIWKVIVSFRLSLKMSYYILQALTATISSNAHGTAMQHITMERMNNSVIPIPPIEEQEKLVNYIELKSSQIDTLISIKQQKIDELKEYKKSMIYEYITGKKQVPE